MSKAQNAEHLTLEQLANKKFDDLTAAERTLLRAAVVGQSAYCGPNDKGPDAQENAPGNANGWGRERQIRAELIAWLCVDHDANQFVHSKGLTVACAKIISELNLSTVRVPFPLIFFRCYFSCLLLLYSDLFLLSLDGCLLRPDSNNRMAIHGDSLRARTLNLRNGFRALGEVNLRGAEIASNLECDGGHILNPGGTALSLNAARVGGGIFLRNGFIAEGEVNLAGVKVGLALDCTIARFQNPGARAFSADDAIIERKVDFTRVVVAGEASLIAAQVGSDFVIDASDFSNGTLRLERTRIAGAFFARKTHFGSNGFMDLSGASVSSLDDDPQSWPSRDHVELDGFLYDHLRRPNEARHRLDLLNRQPLVGTQGVEPQRVRAQPYRQLAKVLRDMGYEKESQKILIGLERQRDLRETFGRCEKVLRWLYGISLAYGYEPHKRAVVIGVLFFVIGWVAVGLANHAGLIVPVSELATSGVIVHSQPHQLSPILYSLDILLPIHAFRQEENWWPKAEDWHWCACWPTALPWAYMLRLWISFEIVIGWILTGLIVAGFAGIVRRE